MLINLTKILIPRAISASGVIILTILAPLISSIEYSADFFTGIALIYFLGIISRGGMDLWVLKEKGQWSAQKEKTIEPNDLVALSTCSFLATVIGFVYYFIFRADGNLDWVFMSLPAFASIGVISFLIRGAGLEVWASLSEVGIISFVTAIVSSLTLAGLPSMELKESFVYASWLTLALSLILIRLHFKYSPRKKITINYAESLQNLANQTITYLAQWYPVFLFGFMGDIYVVCFSLANRMATIIVFVGSTIDSYSAPRYASFFFEKKHSELSILRAQLAKLSRIGAISSLLVVASVTSIYGVFQGLGKTYQIYSAILLFCYAVAVSLGPNGYYLIMTGRNSYVLANSFIFFSISAILVSIFYLAELDIFMVMSVGLMVLSRQVALKLEVDRLTAAA